MTNDQFQQSAIGDYIIMIDPQIQRVEPMISFLSQKIKLSRSQNRIAKVRMPAIAQDDWIFSKAASTVGRKPKYCSRLTVLTVWVTRALVTICEVPPLVSACFFKCTKAPIPELSTKSIWDKSNMMCFGPSSTYLPSTLRKVGSEKASSKPVNRNNW